MMYRTWTPRWTELTLCALLWAALPACMEVNDDRLNDGGASGGACDLCHSSQGNSGAHAAHVSGNGTFGKAFACEECHPVPSGAAGGTHENTVIDVVFPAGGLASARGAQPTWNGARCSGVYCHGATLGDGTYTEPLWVDESLPDGMQCGDCHAIPPPSPHPQEDDESCSECHEGAMSGGMPKPETHINGSVQFDDEGEDDGLGARP